jgi:uncharacterized protein (DUF2141 family)
MKQRLLFAGLLITLYYGCASITTPSGGPRDLKPPILISSLPPLDGTNFKGKRVELTFNEPIKLNNPKEEIIISPSPGKNIEMLAKGTKVTITPKIPWRDSTTYSILFREGIKDVTEGNSPLNLQVAFSTGPEIDSLHITGKVVDLLKGTIQPKITVGIYSSDTFNIFTDTATYFTKTDKRGNFKLANIKAGTYRIYAFEDRNKNLRTESQVEPYAFSSAPLNLQKNIDSLRLNLIMLDSRQMKTTTIRNIGAITRIRFNKYLEDYTLKPDSTLIHCFGDTQEEILIWNPISLDSLSSDSLQLTLAARDSLQTGIDTIFFVRTKNIKTPKEKFKFDLGKPSLLSETGKFMTLLSYNKPIRKLLMDSLFLKIDTTQIIPITQQEISINTKTKKLTITKQLEAKLFQATKEPKIKLLARKNFIITADSDTSTALSIDVPILWPDETGIVIVEAVTTEKHFILQLLDRSGKEVATIRDQKKYSFKNLPPSEYQLRAIIDSNNNGKWDPGNIYQGIEPEKVIFYKTPKNKQTFTMRANWENGPLFVRF